MTSTTKRSKKSKRPKLSDEELRARRNARSRRWKALNRDKVLASRKRDYLKNKQRWVDYAKANRAAIRKRQREWEAKNRDHVRELHRKWEKANPESRRRSVRKTNATEGAKASKRKWAKRNRAYCLSKTRKWNEENRKRIDAWAVANPEKIKAAARKWRESNKHKRRAQKMVATALRSGKLRKLPCERCGVTRVHAHHDDYSKPLKVRWLCAKHHGETHRRKA